MISVSLCSLVGHYDNPIPTRFLAPIDCSKIPALNGIYFMHLGFDLVLHCAEQQEVQVARRPPLPGTSSRTSGGDGITMCASQPTSRGPWPRSAQKMAKHSSRGWPRTWRVWRHTMSSTMKKPLLRRPGGGGCFLSSEALREGPEPQQQPFLLCFAAGW